MNAQELSRFLGKFEVPYEELEDPRYLFKE
jgi:hypothetical protein